MPRLTKNQKKKKEQLTTLLNIKKTSNSASTRNVIKSLMIYGYYIIENESNFNTYF